MTGAIHEMNLKKPVAFLALGVESPHTVRITWVSVECDPALAFLDNFRFADHSLRIPGSVPHGCELPIGNECTIRCDVGVEFTAEREIKNSGDPLTIRLTMRPDFKALTTFFRDQGIYLCLALVVGAIFWSIGLPINTFHCPPVLAVHRQFPFSSHAMAARPVRKAGSL